MSGGDDGYEKNQRRNCAVMKKRGQGSFSLSSNFFRITRLNLFLLCAVILFGIGNAAELAPVADFSSDITEGPVPLEVHFSDESTGGNPSGWAWFFGDETYTAPWTTKTAAAPWEERTAHSSVLTKNRHIVLTGGYVLGAWKNDTWISDDYGETWTEINGSSGWGQRASHSSVALSDGSIVLMGGSRISFSEYMNDTWRSTDNGEHWTLINSDPGWEKRSSHKSVVMPDNSIILMGGEGGYGGYNDTWRSTDKGETWVRRNASSGWIARGSHSSVVMPDGSIVLMGGSLALTGSYLNDTWRSTDYGAHWTLMNSSCGWAARSSHNSVVMPDGSIVLTGGYNGTVLNDMWRSTDKGATWTLVNPSPGWHARSAHTSLAMEDGSILIMGGFGQDSPLYLHDVWSLQPAGYTGMNPGHTYSNPGIYSVALIVRNSGGFNSTRKTGYIIAVNPVLAKTPGLFRSSTGHWYLDYDTDGVTDKQFRFGAVPGDQPLVGDWDGDGTDEPGIFRPSIGYWYLDYNTDGVTDKKFRWGVVEGDQPLVGDWDGDGTDEPGIFRPSTGYWYLDYNTDGVKDTQFTFGPSGGIPLVGDWDGDGTMEPGLFKDGNWYLDYNSDGTPDTTFRWGVSQGDQPVIGNWNSL